MLKAFIFDLGGTLLHYETAAADLVELNRRGFTALHHHLSAKGQVMYANPWPNGNHTNPANTACPPTIMIGGWAGKIAILAKKELRENRWK